MPTRRQARHGSALLSLIASLAVSTATAAPPVQADASVTNGEGEGARGLDRGRAPVLVQPASPAPPPQAENADLRLRTPKGARVPTPDSGESLATAPSGSLARQSYNEYLVRDRGVAICLTAARRAIAENRAADAMIELQALFDAASDVFVWLGEDGAPAPARVCAAELFRQLPASAIAEYERRYGPDAQRLLDESRREPDGTAHRELLRRFEFTTAGAAAVCAAADTALDRGEFAEAARLYRRWLSHPAAARIRDDEIRLRAEAAVLLAGLQGHIVELPVVASNPPERHVDNLHPLESRLDALRPTFSGIAASTAAEADNWRFAFGDRQMSRRSRGTMPTLEPLWSASHSETDELTGDGVRRAAFEPVTPGHRLMSHWRESRAERRLPFAGATFAIVEGDSVIVRDFSGITARNLASGEIEWRFNCESSLSRSTARLQAAAESATTPDPPIAAALLFNELVAQNSVLGMLASDGDYVFCVDQCPQADADAGAGETARANRLLALALKCEGLEPGTLVWQTEDDDRFYLGAPLPSEYGLLSIAERDSLVCVVALDPDSGRIRWEQPISLVDTAIENDPQRARQACTPTLASGILVCPTQLGTIVGVDARSGTLEWVYAYTENNGPSQPWKKTRAFDREYGSPEYPNLPVIVDGTVIVLAPQSNYVHAIDLHSGEFHWKEKRLDSQYVVAADHGVAILVGLRECRALGIADGHEEWTLPIDSPSGRGLALADAFLLPTGDGRIVSIDIRTGRPATDFLPRTSRQQNVALRIGDGDPLDIDSSPTEMCRSGGNLLCCGRFIVSCSPAGVSVFPQAGVVLDAIVEQSRTSALTAADWLERGELELRLGDVDAAEESLWNAVQGRSSPQTRIVATSRLRELMYVQLAAGQRPEERLEALGQLCIEPVDRARYLVHKLSWELTAGDEESAVGTSSAIRALGIAHPVALDAAGEYAVVPERLAAAALIRQRSESSSRMRRILQHDDSSEPRDGMLEIAEFGGSTPKNRVARRKMVERLIDDREFQAAELMLLAETRLRDVSHRHAAEERLAALWKTCGLDRDAARLQPAAGEGEAASPQPQIAHARIEQSVAGDAGGADEAGDRTELEALFARGRVCSRTTAGTRVLIDRGRQPGQEPTTLFSVVDLIEPNLVADLDPLPVRVWKCGDTSRFDAGHFVPIVGQGDVHGLSLLEGRILWSASPKSHRTGEKPQLGPFGPEYCILQSHEIVTALDPRDGRVLWRRTDLPYDAGLVRDETIGMLADDCALVIFDADLTAWRLLDPRSGELLCTGNLEAGSEPRRRGWAFGRRLLYVTPGPEARVKLWDPLLTDPLFDEPCNGRCLIDSGLGADLAVILNGRQLTVLDTASGQRIWETELSEKEASATRQIRAFRESLRLCIHLEQDVSDSPTSPVTNDINDVPNVPISGMLYVIEPESGAFWSRAMPRCNLLLFPYERLPFFVTLGRLRESPTDRGAGFVMEVIDGATGRMLARRNDLVRTSNMLLHSRYDPANRSLQLRGRDAVITVGLTVE